MRLLRCTTSVALPGMVNWSRRAEDNLDLGGAAFHAQGRQREPDHCALDLDQTHRSGHRDVLGR